MNKRGYLIWLRLAGIYNNNLKGSNELLRPTGLSSSHFDCMNQIGIHKRLSQNELAELLVVSKGNVTHLLKRLEEEGYIAREREWKVKYITLTPKGKELLTKLRPSQESFQAHQFGALTLEEQKQLLKLLRKIK